VKYKQGADFGGSGSTAVAEIDKMPKEQAKEIQATVFVELIKEIKGLREDINAQKDMNIDYERLGLELAKGLKRVKY
jgi:hypothetical protein